MKWGHNQDAKMSDSLNLLIIDILGFADAFEKMFLMKEQVGI